MRPHLLVPTAALLLALAPAARAATTPVQVQFSAFGPGTVDVLPGETVEWENVSERRHTVTADNGAFDSGDIFSGQRFSHTFDAGGTYAYHCTVHDGMIGTVDVQPVTMGPLPTAAVPAGDPVTIDGRTADPGQPVRIERGDDGNFKTVATAQPAADGSWRTSLRAEITGDLRAANDAGASTPKRLLVSDRKVTIRATRRGIAVAVTPALPYARIVVEHVSRERFGWWPALRTRLDYVSRASIKLRRPARVRVSLIDRDGWTALATSRVLALGRRAPAAAPEPHHVAH
jgi:plastocyanin